MVLENSQSSSNLAPNSNVVWIRMYEGTWGIPYTDVRVYEYTIYKYTNIREPSLEQMDRVCQYIIFFFLF